MLIIGIICSTVDHHIDRAGAVGATMMQWILLARVTPESYLPFRTFTNKSNKRVDWRFGVLLTSSGVHIIAMLVDQIFLLPPTVFAEKRKFVEIIV